MSIRINLLPHREQRRQRRKKDFVALIGATAAIAAVAVGAVGMFNDSLIETQESRNQLLRDENAALDKQIAEIASLRGEIEGLKARQEAVENLQSDRTVPVHLLDELVKYTPEGVYVRQIKQDDQKVTIIGTAQSNDRVSELLHNVLYKAEWLERPELGETRAVPIDPKGRDGRRVYEFAMTAVLKRNPRPDAAAAMRQAAANAAQPGTAGAPGAGTPQVATR